MTRDRKIGGFNRYREGDLSISCPQGETLSNALGTPLKSINVGIGKYENIVYRSTARIKAERA